MYLKSLDLQGFKSFPDKTTLRFDSGMTAIVGPNGSGKSNISDAMRWVLGEISTKNLRGSKMEDVIFNGASERRPSSYAEVSMTFDNEDGTLPVEYSEVKITRRLSRSGDSEYRINDRSVRLKDIHELLMNTGASREGYSIIGQGRISEILSTRSEDRRAIFEEAAGIAKYKYKKDEAVRKLGHTEENLTRVNDILSEITARIEPLRIESEKARAYLDLREERKGLEVSLWFEQIDLSRKEVSKLEDDRLLAVNNLELVQNEIDSAQRKIDALFERSQQLEVQLEEQRGITGEKNELIGRMRSKEEVWKNDISHREQSVAQNSELIDALEKRATDLLSSIKLKRELMDRLDGEYGSISIEIADLEGMAEDASRSLEQLRADKTSLLSRITSLEQELNAHRITLAQSRTLEQSSQSRGEELEQRRSAAQSAIVELNAQLEDYRAEGERIRAERAVHEASVRDYTEKSGEVSRELTVLRGKSEALRIKINEDEHRVQTLERMDKLLEGYSGAARSVLTASEKGQLSGIHGPVSQLLSADKKYALAIETALGAAVQNIVTSDEDSAKKAIELLKNTGAGRATFLPLDTIRGGRINEAGLDSVKGFVGVASELVRYSPEYKNIAESLLGRTVISTDMESATQIARRYSYRFRIVTSDGQVINAGGSYTGGSSAVRSGLLTRRSDIDALEEKTAENKKQLAVLSAQDKKLSEKLLELDALRSEAADGLTRCDRAGLENSANIKLTQGALSAQRDVLEKAGAELLSMDENAVMLARRTEEAETAIDAAQSSLDEVRGQLEVLSSSEQEKELYRDMLDDKLSARRIMYVQKKSELDIEGERLDTLSSSLEALRQDCRERSASISKAKDEIEQIKDKLVQNQKEAALLEQYIRQDNERLSALEGERGENERRLNQLNISERDNNAKKEVLLREISRLEARLSSLQGEYGTLLQKMWDEYELTYSDAEKVRIIIPEGEKKLRTHGCPHCATP
ncbi:MAG: chromosome segregation protein SMC [Eubacteriales bacterium]